MKKNQFVQAILTGLSKKDLGSNAEIYFCGAI